MATFRKQNLGYGSYYSAQSGNSGNKMMRLLVVGVIIAVVLGGIFFFISNLGGSIKTDLTLLAVRENSLLQLVNTSQKTIHSGDLATANSNAAILLASDVTEVVASTGDKKLPDNLVKQEADTNTDKLKQASLLDKFDTTYRQVVLDKASNLIAQAQKVRSSASSSSNRAQLDTVLANLNSINKQFTDVSLE